MLVFFLKGSKRWFALSILAAFLLTSMEMLIPQIISFTVDHVLGSEEMDVSPFVASLIEKLGGIERLADSLWILALAIGIVGLFSALGKYINMYANAKASESMMLHMRKSIFSHLQKLPYSWHSKNQTGDIIQRSTSDVDTIRNFVSEQLTSVFRIVVLISFSLFCMFSMHTMLAIISACFIPIVLGYSTIFRSKIAHYFEECDENEGVLSTIAQENLTGVRVVRAFGREAYEKERFEKQNQHYTNAWIKFCRILNIFWMSGDLISAIQVMTIIVSGAILGANGQLTEGTFIAFVSYNSMLVWPVRQLGRVLSEMSKAGVSIDRIRAIMNAEPEANDATATPSLSGDIVFSHVSYAYEKVPVLEDVSFTVKGGSVLGILGSTGAGKSTLMYLLDRLLELEQGSITIGGVDIRDIDRVYLRKNIGIVLQEPYLFSRTIGENITITQDHTTPEDLARVTETACLDDTIEGMTEGYDTMVGERGVTGSGGQKQRTAIARMLLQNAPIMIFDDSLSAVDAVTDAKIRELLSRHFGSATVVLISHRITTLMQADHILVMDQGKIAEEGCHKDLLAQGGIYSQIFALQSADAQSRKED